MAATEILRARVDKDFAKRVARWARAHDVDVSEAIRMGLLTLLEQEEREAKVRKALATMDEAARLGLFDPPSDDSWKAGGFR